MSKCNVSQRLRTSLVLFCVIFSGVVVVGKNITCSEGEKPCADNDGCYSDDDVCDSIPDCFDKTDEQNCGKSCSDIEFYCEADDECFALSSRCDGHEDCSDGSDEEQCENVTCSLGTEFMCVADKICVDGSLRCDGQAHCHDGSDEVGCDDTTDAARGCDSESRYDCKGDGTECIALDKRCNGHRDCADGEDENDASCRINSTSPCDVNNGGCSHDCLENEHGHHCECPDGLQLTYDHKTCEGEEPEVWLTNGSSLVQYKLHSHDRKITNLGGSLHGFGYGYNTEKIFWIDSVKRAIHWSDKDASSPEILIDTMKDVPVALAYDWVHNNLYWADAGHHVKIEVVTLDHKWRTVIVHPPDVDHPKALVVDPRSDEGYVYWAQGGDDPVIKRAGLDGSEAMTIISSDIGAVYALALDVVDDRLFWIDSRLNIVESFGLRTSDREVLTTFVEYPKLPTGIDVFEDFVYWADSEAKEVFKMHKFRTEGEEKPAITSVLKHLTFPKTVTIFHEMKQPEDNSYCGENNGGCSHICLPSPHFVKFHCVCPMSTIKTQRFIPDPDNASSCLLLDGASSSTLRPSNSTHAGPKAHSSDIASSAPTPVSTIFKSLLPSGYSTTGSWEEEGKAGQNNDNLWLHIGVGGAVGLVLVLLLSVIGYKLYSRHIAKNLHFDNPVFEQKPLRTSIRQADSRA